MSYDMWIDVVHQSTPVAAQVDVDESGALNLVESSGAKLAVHIAQHWETRMGKIRLIYDLL